MKRYIDADALKDRLQSLAYDDWNQGAGTTWANAYSEVADMIDEFPSADVWEVKRGRWEMKSNYPDMLICSECDGHFDCWHWELEEMRFCPNCGADMREE